MTKKQKIVATQKIYDHKVRVVTGCLVITADEDWEYRNEDGSILEQGKAGDVLGYKSIEGKYGYEIFNEKGFQVYASSGYTPVELYPEWLADKYKRLPKFKTIEQAIDDAEGMIESFLEYKGELDKYGVGAQTQQDRKFHRSLSGWGEPDDWVGDRNREDPLLSDDCWTCWKNGIGG